MYLSFIIINIFMYLPTNISLSIILRCLPAIYKITNDPFIDGSFVINNMILSTNFFWFVFPCL